MQSLLFTGSGLFFVALVSVSNSCTVISNPSNTRAGLAKSDGIGLSTDPYDHTVSQIPRSSERCPDQGLSPARALQGLFFDTYVTQGARGSLAKVAQPVPMPTLTVIQKLQCSK
jgi:hypothetical protein